MTDKWAEYRNKFCGCKDASRDNSCKGRPNCELRADHPERKQAMNSDIKDHSNDVQQEAHGLEVAAWMVDEDGSAEQQPLCRLSDATAVIDHQGRRIELLDEDNRQLRERVAELEADKVLLVEDRARFPDRPDFIGNMIAAHFGNLRAGQAQAQKYADSYRRRMEIAEEKLAALESAPVVMPDRRTQALAGVSLFDLGHAKGWNTCLDEFKRLNRIKTNE